MFVQHIPQVFNEIEIRGLWRPSQCLELDVPQTLSRFFRMAGRLILMNEGVLSLDGTVPRKE